MRMRGDLNASGGNHRLELIDVPSGLEFFMARWRGIIPEIGEV